MFNKSQEVRKEAEKAREELEPFFKPEGIAVIGASREKGTEGWEIFRNLLEGKKEGKLSGNVYGVNVKGGEILGEKLYESILDIDGKVDHAIFSIPAKYVNDAMKEAGEKGVKVATIVTAGFSEVGNVELEEELEATTEEYGIRVIGPNGLGEYDPYHGVDTMFIPKYKGKGDQKILSAPRPKEGFITFFSQSGALGLACLDYMSGQGMGISKFISAGNRIDVDEEDTLLFALDDPHTRVISFYIEGLEEGAQRLVDIGKEVTKHKPIVVLKGGKSQAGARATQSHTASLAGDYRIYNAAFDQMGAIVTDDLIDFIDAQKALALQPPAKGKKVAVVTNGGGAGVLSTDEAAKNGLEMPPFPEKTKEKFHTLIEQGILREFSTFANPCDITGSGDTKGYVEATKTVLEDETFDAVLVIALHHPPAVGMDLAERLYEITKQYTKPVIMANFGSAKAGELIRKKFNNKGVPAYPSPERGMRALSILVEYGKYLKERGVLGEHLKKYEKPNL